MLVPPSQFLRSVAEKVAPVFPAGAIAVVATKGIEEGSLKLLSEVLAEVLPQAVGAGLLGVRAGARVRQDQAAQASPAEELEKISKLHDSGKLSDEEFNSLKAKILSK